jgi:hypothetical protein
LLGSVGGEHARSMETLVASQLGTTDFDFFVGSWDVHNRRQNADGMWEEWASTNTVTREVDGFVQVDYYDAPDFPGRGHVKAVTFRAFNAETEEWSIVWLSNYSPPDLRPVVGRFEDGVGTFFQFVETADGDPLHVKFVWDEIGEDHARWRQFFSYDEGGTWELNWVMEFTRRS